MSAKKNKITQKLAKILAVLMVLDGLLFIPSQLEAATQNAWRWRNDDGTEATATWKAAENTAITGVDKNVPQRLRFGVNKDSSESDFVKQETLAFGSGENNIYADAIDAANGYIYFGTNTSPGKIIKVDLATFTKVATLDLSAGEDFLKEGFVHDGYAYFGTWTAPAKIIKIDLATFSKVGTITAASGENYISSSTVYGNYAYFGTFVDPGKVIKVDLSTFTRSGSLTFPTGEVAATSASAHNGYAYFGTWTNPGKVIKVDLSTFTRSGALTLSSGVNYAYSSVESGGYLYVGNITTPAKVAKVDLSTFTHVNTLTMNSGENSLPSAATDGQYAYFTNVQNPVRVIRIDLSTFTRSGSVDVWPTGSGLGYTTSIDTTNGYIYNGLYTSPGNAVRVSTKSHFGVQYAVKPSSGGCAAATGWQTANSDAGAWVVADAAGLSSGAATTDSAGLANGATTFAASDQVEGDAPLASPLVLDTDEFTEVEFGIKATASAVDGATYCFRAANENSATGFTHSGYAEATLASSYSPTTANGFTATRLSAGSTSTFGLQFDLPSAQSTPLTVYFPSGFTVSSAFTSGACSGGGTIGNFQVGTNGLTITADKSSCSGTVTLSGASITLPSTSGLYTVYYVNDSPGEVVIPVTDDDQVSVTGNVDPTLTFDLDVGTSAGETPGSYAVDLGALTSSAPSGSDNSSIDSVFIDLATNAAGGATVTVRSAYAALRSASSPTDEISSGTAALAGGTEGYGICVASATGTQDGGDTFGAQSPYASTCTAGSFSVGLLQATAQDLLVASGPIASGSAEVRVAASISTVTPAHPDYTDTLTFLAAATY